MNEDKSTRYHRIRRRVELFALCVWVMFLVGILGSDTAHGWIDALAHLASLRAMPDLVCNSVVVASYTFVVVVIGESIVSPLLLYSEFVLKHRFHLSRRRLTHWMKEHAKKTIAHVAVVTFGAVVFYAAMWIWPMWWWLIGGGMFAVLTIALTHFAPIITIPRLYHLRPLGRNELQNRLELLLRRTGVPAMSIEELQLGSETPRPNAALVGIGSTSRVLLTDALLADYSDDEIEVVLAHEIGHFMHHDVWKTMAFETASAVLIFGVAQWVFYQAGPMFGLASVADVVGFPILVLAGGAVLLMLTPVRNMISRRHERQADQYALAVTKKPDAFISGLRRLARQSLAEEQPSRLAELLFYSHPPLSDRLATANLAKLSNF